MAKQVDTKRFIELVQSSGLVDEDQFAKAMEKIRRRGEGKLPARPAVLGAWLIKAGLLTDWQTRKLLEGRHRGFFLGKYKLMGRLGRGGMSRVYLAEHSLIGRLRAIKVLPRRFLADPEYLESFRHEARTAAALDHPHIVKAYDIDSEGSVNYIVMEYVEGRDLQSLVVDEGLPSFKDAAEYIRQAAIGLQYAHEKGLIHRDIKPANLLLDTSGVVKILDLGLAMFSGEQNGRLGTRPRKSRPSDSYVNVGESASGVHNRKIVGTADYLAPEQSRDSSNVDHRVDIYGLGGTLYFLLTGHPPFPEGSVAERIRSHRTIMPEEIQRDRPNCPGELTGICTKMLQKEPVYRYYSAAQAGQAIERWLSLVG